LLEKKQGERRIGGGTGGANTRKWENSKEQLTACPFPSRDYRKCKKKRGGIPSEEGDIKKGIGRSFSKEAFLHSRVLEKRMHIYNGEGGYGGKEGSEMHLVMKKSGPNKQKKKQYITAARS